jgi:hypothetical protein
MSSQSISNIIALIKARFEKLQNKLQNQEVPEPDNSKQQSKDLPRCITAVSKNPQDLERSQGSQWWARIYRGLVIDSSARHYLQMGPAVWLFLYFLLNANNYRCVRGYQNRW